MEDEDQKKGEKYEGENECYEYKLVGVTVHVGTADAGHYYSYINTNR
jgi:ubiquitin C-terminal hydrolase